MGGVMGQAGLYANRVRCAHIRRHTRKSRYAFAAVVLLVIILLGLACRDDQKANEDLSREYFNPSRRAEIVAYWSEGERSIAR
jgi:nitrate reductase gamma subunit